MVELCVSGFLVISVITSILFWAACVVSKRTDDLQLANEILIIDISEEKPGPVILLASGND